MTDQLCASKLAFVLVAVLIGASSTKAQLQPVQLTEEQTRSFDPLGHCEQNGHSIDMRRVMFLENRSIDMNSRTGPLRISIDHSDFIIEEVGQRSRHRRFINDVANTIDPAGNLDIELKLAYYNGNLLLYWKETFQNRHYRQGLFNIVGADLTPLCTGVGGRYAVR